MAVVQSFGAVTGTSGRFPGWPTRESISLYDGYRHDYAAIYRTQPNVRIVVDFFARNIAQLGLHVFRRVSDTDRVRLTDHGLARTVGKPNPRTTRFRLLHDTTEDFCIYWNAFWLKVRVPNRLGLVRIPAASMHVAGGLLPTEYTWTTPIGERKTFAPEEVVHFRGYDPNNPILGLSPMETLRRILAEESAAGLYREGFWQRGAHIDGVLMRPKQAPKWNTETKDKFRSQWQEKFGGVGQAGGTPILEDGMEFKPATFSARDSEYLGAAQLSREVCAAAWHVPQPMVGILEHATFSNIKEQHKMLYQDALGPTLVMLEEDVELQLLPEFDDSDDVYCEFNIAEKLKGSFEEQAAAIQLLTGGPIMTPNEGRARLNLPRDKDPKSDELRRVANVEGKDAADNPPPFKPTKAKQKNDDDEDEE